MVEMVKGSKRTVITALLGNFCVAVFKLIAGIVGNSSSMLAESFHSFSDTFNQVFLLVGLRKSRKLPDEEHPYGYGTEQFFWAFVVAMMIFGIAGGLSIYEGYVKLVYPEPLGDVTLSYMALALGFVLEFFAFSVAFRQLRREMKQDSQKNVYAAIRQSKDPTVLTVLFEDSLAMFGMTVAGIAVYLSSVTGDPIYDAVASIIIGIGLMIFATMLGYETKSLLVGEAVTPYKRRKIWKAVENVREVREIIGIRTMHISPEEAIVAVEVNLQDGLITDQIEAVIDDIENRIHRILPKAKCFIELESEGRKKRPPLPKREPRPRTKRDKQLGKLYRKLEKVVKQKRKIEDRIQELNSEK